MKWYRVPFEYALYEMSYENLILYGRVIPSFDKDDEKGKENVDSKEETCSVDNPEDWKKIREFYRKQRKR